MNFKWSALRLAVVVSTLVPTLQDTTYPTTGGKKGAYRLLIQRPDSTGVFSGDFNTNSSASVASLQPSFTGQYTNLEVVDVNATNSTGSASLTPAQLCAYLKAQNPDVTSCEPDVQVQIDGGAASPDDPNYVSGLQWDMPLIDVTAVWQQGQYGSAAVKVCMIDTGVDLQHPDIQANLWINPVEKAGKGATAANGYQNGIDDDGNGIIDDIYGADFVDGSTDGAVQDQNGHGTFVSGVVGAVGNNGIGVTGVNQQVSLVICRFMDASGNGWVSDAIRCIEYCISKGAHVMSNSWGGVEYSDSLQTAINQATQRGVLFVASAGNDGVDTDTTPHYPSSLPDDIVLAVAASTRTDTLWPRSNYGISSVDLAAPGVQVYNLGLGGNYIRLTGTSMATPHVSGAAALLLAKFAANGFNISSGLGSQVKKLLLSSTKTMPETGTQIMHGRLDVGAAYALVPVQASSSTGSFGSTESAGSIESYDAGSPDSTDALSSTNYSTNGGATTSPPTPPLSTATPATAGNIPTTIGSSSDSTLTFLGNAEVLAPAPGRRLLQRQPPL